MGNIFRNLMLSSRIEGREDYLTEVVRAVLDEDHGLARHLVRELVGVDLDEELATTVATQVEHRVGSTSSVIDMEVRVGDHALIMFEHKVDSALGEREFETAEGDTSVGDQVAKYVEVLRSMTAPPVRLLVVVGLVPTDVPTTEHTVPWRSWWDVYTAVASYRGVESSSAHAAWLRRQLLEFMEAAHLDAPRVLRPGDYDGPRARRVVAEALRRIPGAFTSVRRSASPGFNLRLRERNILVVLGDGPSLRAFETNRGLLIAPPIEDAVWTTGTVADQVEAVRAALGSLDRWPLGERRRLTPEEALARYGTQRSAAEAVADALERNSGRAGRPMTNEVVFALGDGLSVRMVPSAEGHVAVAAGQRFVERAADLVTARLGVRPERRREQVNVLLRDVGARADEFVGVLDELKGMMALSRT